MTGTPHAIASSAASPKDSLCDGSRNRSAQRRMSPTSSTFPKKRTSLASPSRSTSVWAPSRSGPSPTRTSVAGTARRTPAKTRITSAIRLTGRKFETWTRILWSAGAKRWRRAPGGRALLERRVVDRGDFVEGHALDDARQPERAGIGDEVDVVPAPGELQAQLGRDRAGAAVGRVTGDADSHARRQTSDIRRQRS